MTGLTTTAWDRRDQLSYAIVGTGALGGFYGSRLQASGCEVHFLLHRDYEHVRVHGLQIESPIHSLQLPQVNAYANVADMPACDVVVVALKTTQNHLLPDLIPPIIKPNGIVLVLQNGLGGEDQVAAIVGSDRVMGGLCFISANKIGLGRIRHIDYGTVKLADYASGYIPQGITPRMIRIGADFEQAGIPIVLAPDLLQTRWEKLVWNIPFNGLSVVLNATTDQIMQDPLTRQLAQHVMEEVVAGAAACGRILSETIVADMLARTEKMAPYRTSMKVDYECCRPLEVEAIVGYPLHQAQQAGTHLLRIEMLYTVLTALDRQNRAT